MIKLKPGEARQLANLLREIGRPQDADEEADMWRWVKRLEGAGHEDT